MNSAPVAIRHTPPRFHFGDGSQCLIRTLKPEDKGPLADAFQRLSDTTRYRRFLNVKKILTPEELCYLTEFDGSEHLAIGAVLLDEAGQECEFLGVAQFVRLAAGADVAEAAIVVADEWQHRGIGRRLLEHLMFVAHRHDVTRFRCHLLTDNHEVRRLLSAVCWDVSFRRDGILIAAEFPIGPQEAAQSDIDTELFDILRLAAEGYFTAPFVLTELASRQWWLDIQQIIASWHQDNTMDAA